MEGLRFACPRGCTNCCEQHGYVCLTEEDVKRAAAHLGLTARAFEAKYVYRTRSLLRVRKPRGSLCHLLVDGGCSIHPSKPTQCRLFPFRPESVEDRRAWKAAATGCPGIGKGRLVQIGTALEKSREMREACPFMYWET
jgi:hypothetical protein